MKSYGSLLVVMLWWGLLVPAQAGRPTDEVKSTTDRVLAILNDASLQGEARKSERRLKLHQELAARFEWTLIARGCLGRHWLKRSPEEQREFIRCFTRLLEETYLGKIETYYTDLDRIVYQGERIIDNAASVKVLVTTKKGQEHPVEYRLEQGAGGKEWRVYDVLIEGVSMVKNYRVQFDEIMAKSSFDQLIADIKAKLEQNKE